MYYQWFTRNLPGDDLAEFTHSQLAKIFLSPIDSITWRYLKPHSRSVFSTLGCNLQLGLHARKEHRMALDQQTLVKNFRFCRNYDRVLRKSCFHWQKRTVNPFQGPRTWRKPRLEPHGHPHRNVHQIVDSSSLMLCYSDSVGRYSNYGL